MPITVFPAPGCSAGKQYLSPFSSFDIGPYSGGTFKNLLLYSENQSNAVWVKGSGTTVVPEFDGTAVVNYTNPVNNTISWYTEYSPTSDLFTTTLVSPVPALGQTLTVTPNTTYTFSFHAKSGTATAVTYGIYDKTNAATIVAPTGYYSQLNKSTFTRITSTFTTNSTCTSITVYPLWTGTSVGTVTIFGTQLELGNTASIYQKTVAISFAASGYVPQTISPYASAGKLKDSFVLKSAPNIQVTSQLQKNLEIIKSITTPLVTAKVMRNAVLRDTRAQLLASKLKSSIVVRGDKNLPFDADVVSKFKMPTLASGLFFPPASSVLQKQMEVIRGDRNSLAASKLSIAARLRADSTKLDTNRIKSGVVLRADRSPVLDIDVVSKFKIAYNTTEIFYTPPSSRLSVFQNTPNQSDFKFTVVAQTPDTVTSYLYPDLSTDSGVFDLNSDGAGASDLTATPNSLVDWYLEYGASSELLSSATPIVSKSATKTYTYTSQNLLVNQLTGTLTIVADSTAGSIQFNGTSDYLTVPYSSMITTTTTTPLTAECWIYMDTATSAIIMSEEWTGGGNISMTMATGAAPGVAGTNVWFGWYDGATWRIATSTQQLQSGKWYHIAGVFNGTQIQIYINGQPDGSLTYPWGNDSSATTLFIGRRWDTAIDPNQVYFPGYISNVRIVKGTALYTAPFTPSTSVLTAVPGTQLLLQTKIDRTGFTDTSINAALVTKFGAPKLVMSNPGFTTQTMVYTQVSNPNGVYNPFDVGSLVKITDVKENTSYYAPVLASTYNSVTIAQPDWFIPTSGITLESGATVYSKDVVDPVTAPVNPRENFYYFNLLPQLRADKTRSPSLALVTTQAFGVPDANTMSKQLEIIRGDRIALLPSQLQKQIEVVRGDTISIKTSKISPSLILRGESTKIRAEKLNIAAVLRGDKNLPFDADVLSKFKIAVNTTEVFYVPLNSNLQQQVAILRGDKLSLRVDELSTAAVLRGDRAPIFDTDSITKFKISFNTTEVFDSPLSSNMQRQVEVIRGEATVFKTFKVSAAIQVRGDAAVLKSDRLKTASVLRGDTVPLLDIDFLNKFKISANTTEVFDSPVVNKLQSGFVVRDAKTAYIPALAGAIIKNRVPALFTQVLYTPVSSNLQKQLFTLRSDFTTINVDKLSSTTVIRSDSANLTTALNFTNFISQVNYSTTLAPRNAADRFYYFNIAPSKFADRYQENTSFTSFTQIFDSPLSSTLPKQFEVMRGDQSVLSVAKLKDSFVVRGDTNTIAMSSLPKQVEQIKGDSTPALDIDFVSKFKIAVNTTEVFYTPVYSQLQKQVESIKGDQTVISTAKLIAALVVRGDSTKIQTAKVKAGFAARGDSNKFSVDNVRNQKFISSTVSLFDTPKINKLAASIVVRADRTVITANKLSQFAISNQPGDFKVLVSGQINAGNPNVTTLDWYLGYGVNSELVALSSTTDDLGTTSGSEDLLTSLGNVDLTPDPVTYFFAAQSFVPFDVGSTVKVSNINGPFTFFATVTAATKNSVSFAQPSWYVTTSGTYVESGSTVFPQNYVDPQGPAINARENLYYFNLAPSLRADRYQLPNAFAGSSQVVQLDSTVPQLAKQFEVIRDVSRVAYTADNFDNYRDQTAPVLWNPTTPIENLYYFNLAPALRADHWQHRTDLNSQLQVFETPKLLKLSSARVLRESVRSSLLNYNFSIKQLKTPASGSEVFFVRENRGVVTLPNLIRGLAINKPEINSLDRLKLNSGRVEVFDNPNSGFVIRFKTGDSKTGQRGIQDPAAQKKEPIQFWN